MTLGELVNRAIGQILAKQWGYEVRVWGTKRRIQRVTVTDSTKTIWLHLGFDDERDKA